ncbi:MAG: glycoside hydrolase family 26 protein [Thermodesulfobacteriota bacterium]
MLFHNIPYVVAPLLGILLALNTTAFAQDSRASFLFGLTLQGLPLTQEQIRSEEAILGVPARMVTFYLQWPPTPQKGFFPQKSLDAIRKFGAVPCLTWEPMFHEQGRERMVPAEAILQGKYDPYLRAFAQSAADWDHPFILRFAHEMNLARYHWGTSRQEYGPESPHLYRKIFRYVVNIFREQGADNVLFAFCPNAESVPNANQDPAAAWNTIAAYYPGDEYVQVFGVDGYNWGRTQNKQTHGWTSSWRSFRDIFVPALRQLREIHDQKPLVIFETGSAREGGDRDQWLGNGLKVAQEWGIQGLSWFQVDKEVNWRLEWGDIPQSGPRLRQLTAPGWPWMAALTAEKTNSTHQAVQPTHTCPDKASSPGHGGGNSE